MPDETRMSPKELVTEVEQRIRDIRAALERGAADEYVQLSNGGSVTQTLGEIEQRIQEESLYFLDSHTDGPHDAVQEAAIERMLGLIGHAETLQGKYTIDSVVLEGRPASALNLRTAHLEGTRHLWPDGVLAEIGSPAWITNQDEPMDVLGLPAPARVIDLFLGLREIAVNEGMLALESHLERLPGILGSYVELVVDGTPPDLIHRVHSARLKQFELEIAQLRHLYVYGSRFVARGDAPRIIQGTFGKARHVLEPDAESPEDDDETPTFYEKMVAIFETVAEDVRRYGGAEGIRESARKIGDECGLSGTRVTQIMSAFREDPIMLSHAFELYCTRLDRELSVAGDLLLKGAQLLQRGVGAEDFREQLWEVVPPTREFTLDQLQHLPQVLAQWKNPEPELRRIESLAQVAEELRSLSTTAGFEFTHNLPTTLTSPTLLDQARTTLLERLHTARDAARKTYEETWDAVTTARNVVKDAAPELTELYERFTARSASVRNSISSEQQDALIAGKEADPAFGQPIADNKIAFKDLAELDDQAVQTVLREVDVTELGIALTGADASVHRAVIRNLPQRAVAFLQETMEDTGPTTQEQRMDAQRRIAVVIEKLRDAGDIVIGGDEESV